ncbi:MAG: hypothetical protein KIT60_06605 [Burkholderiaceae bacterium]|nr:hypothetical protein [Burkholderiaceae bacterium]
MNPHTTQPVDEAATAASLPELREANVPVLVAALYDESPVGLRQRLVNHLLRPLGPLALVAVATGAFARLLPSDRWSGAQVQLDDVLRIRADQVLDLARYVQQKSPEMLWRLPEILGSSPVVLGTLSGVLLLTALRAQAHAAGRLKRARGSRVPALLM